MVADRRDPMIGTMFDERFRIDARIAAGGFGSIYRALDARSGSPVALKVLHASLTLDPLIAARFRREGATMATLRDPHTVTAYELGEAPDGTLYIVMELLRGETLYDAYRANGPLPWRRVATIARAVCSSLAEAHERGIVHRDLKPANIHLQDRDGAVDFVKVLDFGIAKILHGSDLDHSELTHAGQMIGTFDYMAPEQMLGGTVGAACDIYTLGIVMYEMITGRLPFAEATSPTHLLAMLLTTVPPAIGTMVGVPPALDRAVMRCLAREPQDRFASARELAAALDAVLDDRHGDEATLANAVTIALQLPPDEPTIIRGTPPPELIAPEITPPERATPVRAMGSRPWIEPHVQPQMQPQLQPMPMPPIPPPPPRRQTPPMMRAEPWPAQYIPAQGSQHGLEALAAQPPWGQAPAWQQMQQMRHAAWDDASASAARRDVAVRRIQMVLVLLLISMLAFVIVQLI